MKLKDDPNWNEYVETLQELIDWAIQKRFDEFMRWVVYNNWKPQPRADHEKARVWFGTQKCEGWGEGQVIDMAAKYIREELT